METEEIPGHLALNFKETHLHLLKDKVVMDSKYKEVNEHNMEVFLEVAVDVAVDTHLVVVLSI